MELKLVEAESVVGVLGCFLDPLGNEGEERERSSCVPKETGQ